MYGQCPNGYKHIQELFPSWIQLNGKGLLLQHQVGFIPGLQRVKSVNVNQNINRRSSKIIWSPNKRQKNVIIGSTPVHNKNLQQISLKNPYINTVKTIHDKRSTNITLQVSVFPLISEIRPDPHCLLQFNTGSDALARAISQ